MKLINARFPFPLSTLAISVLLVQSGVVLGQERVVAEEESSEVMEEVMVTGSNIQRSGITAVSPVQVVNRDDILADGAKTINDVAINLPINVGSEFQNES